MECVLSFVSNSFDLFKFVELEIRIRQHCKLCKVVMKELKGNAYLLITDPKLSTMAVRVYDDPKIVTTTSHDTTDFDGLQVFRDSFHHPIVLFIMSPHIQQEQISNSKSTFQLAQSALLRYPTNEDMVRKQTYLDYCCRIRISLSDYLTFTCRETETSHVY